MPQIEIPFTPGQRVMWRGVEAIVEVVQIRETEDDVFEIVVPSDENQRHWVYASDLTLVEPVIKWERKKFDDGWVSHDGAWHAYDDGSLYYEGKHPFPNPRAIAETTQEMWNKARKG